jgi:hypothetical protein
MKRDLNLILSILQKQFFNDLQCDRRFWHWYRLARSYKRCNTGGSRNQANLE